MLLRPFSSAHTPRVETRYLVRRKRCRYLMADSIVRFHIMSVHEALERWKAVALQRTSVGISSVWCELPGSPRSDLRWSDALSLRQSGNGVGLWPDAGIVATATGAFGLPHRSNLLRVAAVDFVARRLEGHFYQSITRCRLWGPLYWLCSTTRFHPSPVHISCILSASSRTGHLVT